MIKNILIVLFIIVGMFVIYNFKDHNQKRAIEACVAGSKTLEKPMTASEARICLLYTSPSPRDVEESRMPSSA